MNHKIENTTHISVEGVSDDELEEDEDKKVEGAELTCQFFEEKDNLDRVVYELTTLRDWLILYVRGITEF